MKISKKDILIAYLQSIINYIDLLKSNKQQHDKIT